MKLKDIRAWKSLLDTKGDGGLRASPDLFFLVLRYRRVCQKLTFGTRSVLSVVLEMKIEIPARTKPADSPIDWPNRVLLLSLAGIFFLTLYPFRLTLHSRPLAHSTPFLLGGISKGAGALDIFLNVLLFVPFGFGLSEKLRERAWTRRAIFFAAWIAGFVFSYGIEFTQQFTPSRASRWEDVVTNTTGALAGYVLFELCGVSLVRWASTTQSALRSLLPLHRLALIIPVYFVLWFAFSAALQKQTRLTNWDPASRLVIGNDAYGAWWSAWKGSVSRLQIWNRAMPDDLARSLTSGETPLASQPGLLVFYDFKSSQPLRDRAQFLPDLSWASHPLAAPSQNGVTLGEKSWLSSSAPVPNLVDALRRTNQFSIEFQCSPAESAGGTGSIISISPAPDRDDLTVRQDDSKLVFWFRNPATAGHARLPWTIPDTLYAGQQHDFLFSYDGSNLSAFVDGRKEAGNYELGPGTVLAKVIYRVKTPELAGYAFIYEALIFFPAGVLIGIAAFPFGPRKMLIPLFLGSEFIFAPWLFDRILSHGTGRPVSAETIVVSLILVAAGALWINADGRTAVANT